MREVAHQGQLYSRPVQDSTNGRYRWRSAVTMWGWWQVDLGAGFFPPITAHQRERGPWQCAQCPPLGDPAPFVFE